jgi:micrococcal nuclease
MRNRYALIVYGICHFLAACAASPDASSQLPGGISSPSPSLLQPAPSATSVPSCLPARTRQDFASVLKVLTGDSIEASVGGVAFVVRYIGVAAPDPRADPTSAEEAAAQNRALTGGRNILLIRDISEVDQAGRLPRLIVAGGVLVNERLLRLGVVRAAAVSPDDSCTREFGDAETGARSSRAGLWRFGPADLTKTAVAACTGTCQTPSPGCRIKGNINAKGEKIYHLPGSRDYEKTVIEPAKGERWFCTEAEANLAGWRGGKG